ncbi:MAG TPA: DUF6285 domain-containing protein [Thermoanaerobaculia bacterium]|nr:DUF6285 domain-containing protein [Thermoanaerobaculia bacterium]
MQDRPTLRELLDAAEDYLRTDLRPQLEGHAAFHTLVTANVLAIVKRELDGFETWNAAELERLRAILGGEGGLHELNVELCRRIRAGEIPIDDPRLLDHLIRSTLAKVAIDNPRYAGYQKALRQWPQCAPPDAATFDTRR